MARFEERGPRRVLLVDSCGGEILGGSTVVVNDIIEHVDRSQFVPVLVSMLDGPWPERIRSGGTAAHVIPRKRIRSVGNLAGVVRRLTQVIREERIDVIHASENSALLYASLAGRITRTPVVWHIHSPLTVRTRSERMVAPVLNRVPPAYIVFTSPPTQARTPGFRHVPSSIVYPGVDLERCRSGDAARGRDALGIPQDALVVSMFARFDPTKGQGMFVRCIERAREHYPEILGVMCGFHNKQEPYWDHVQSLVKELGLENQLIMPGHIPPPLKDDIVAASDLILHTAPAEPFGLAVLEAMAAGKAVVAVDSDGPKLLIESGVDGVLVPANDMHSTADAVLDLLGDPQRRATLGVRAVESSAKYSVEHMIEKMQGVWAQVIATAPE